MSKELTKDEKIEKYESLLVEAHKRLADVDVAMVSARDLIEAQIKRIAVLEAALREKQR